MNPGKNRWEKSLIDFCASTLAGLKCANLFGMIYSSEEELVHEISRLNHLCNGKGIQIRVMNRRNRRALLLVFRENMLNQVMEQEYVWELLRECGYQGGGLAHTLDTLAGRIETAESFPHEIGISIEGNGTVRLCEQKRRFTPLNDPQYSRQHLYRRSHHRFNQHLIAERNFPYSNLFILI